MGQTPAILQGLPFDSILGEQSPWRQRSTCCGGGHGGIYRLSEDPLYAAVYHWFNLAEGIVWVALAALVLRRWQRNARSTIELWYALAFFAFGLTDFREAWALQSWLIWLKVANLIALFWLRATVMRRYYPDSKLY